MNLVRACTALPAFFMFRLLLARGPWFVGLTPARAGWLLLSIVCSYALADSLFLTAGRAIGITTALSIASTYPLWAALWGTLVDHEPFGVSRAAGTLLAVGGVIWLVQLRTAPGEAESARQPRGFALAFLVSVLWATNSIGIKQGAEGMNTFDVNVFRFAAAVVLIVPQLWLPTERAFSSSPSGGWGRLIPALIADAVLGSLAYIYGLSHTDLAVGATLSSLAPLISVPFAIALGEERFALRRFAAIVTTVAGVALLVLGGSAGHSH